MKPFCSRPITSINFSLFYIIAVVANSNLFPSLLLLQVVSLAPNHYKARLQLSVIMRTLGRPEDALLALAQDETGEMLNPHLLFNRCQLLREENKEEEFISKAKLLFSRHFVNIRNKEELHAVSSAKRISSKNKALNEVRNFRREPLDETKAAEFEPSRKVAANNLMNNVIYILIIV